MQTGWFRLIDCQLETEHLARFGARDIARTDYLAELAQCLQAPGRVGSWTDAEV